MRMTKVLNLISFFLAIANVKCIQNCISDAVFLHNENISLMNASTYKHNDNNVINVKNLNQSDLPYNVVPEISTYERDFIRILSEKYLSIHRPFDLSQLTTISHECRGHAHKLIESLRNFELWALKFHDSTARFTSGLLNGNVNQLGDFDQCLNVKEPNDEFRGKYCLAYLQPYIPDSLRYSNYLRKLLQSYNTFNSNFDDSGHRVPRWSTINFGVCVPSSCTSRDIENAMMHYTETFSNGTGIQIRVRVESEMCYAKDDKWMSNLDLGTKIAVAACVSLLLVTIASTIYHYERIGKPKNDYAIAFSFIKNSSKLFSFRRDTNDIKTAHGIRFFNALMLLISHKCMAILYMPYSNRTGMIEMISRPWTVLVRAASLYTDPFLMLSGMLTAYSLYGKLQKSGRINVFKEYVSRYFRIMPSLAFLIIICTFILPLLSSGPYWNLVVSHHSDLCKQYWWRNLLFIHNWFGFSNMCLTHTHHVGIDTELFWSSPLLIYALYKWPKRSINVILILAVISTIARYYVTLKYDLSNYISFGISVNQLFKTADLMYALPPHRFTVYAMGIILGYILRKFKDMKLSKRQIKIGWYVSTALLLMAFFGPAHMGDIDYKFDATHAAWYAAAAPIGWCIFFGWIILTSQLGYSNIFTRVFEWRIFLISTRISYALYLVQFPVFFFNVGRIKSSVQYYFPSTVIDLNELLTILGISILFTILIEYPFNNLKELIIDRKKHKSHDDKNQNNNVINNLDVKEKKL